ncbi:MAG: hypothetical protein FJ143_10480, partial [Deltaproteobacteria bacterium]|nr:hypothetical protein [Deltaproteobacteria bacterium]
MNRRSFIAHSIATLSSLFVLSWRSIAEAFCNPSLVNLLHQGRHLAQARGGASKNPSLGSY